MSQHHYQPELESAQTWHVLLCCCWAWVQCTRPDEKFKLLADQSMDVQLQRLVVCPCLSLRDAGEVTSVLSG